MNRSSYILVAVGCVFLSPTSSYAATRYAKVGGSSSGTCTAGWGSACSLGQAINQAAIGDDVWAQAGTYNGSLTLKNGVRIIGGFAGTETSASQSDPAANETILDGGGLVTVTSTNDGPSTLLRGWTVRNGHAATDVGGGMLMTNSSALIVHCVFKNNTAAWWGGGVSIRGASSPQFINCVFHDNGNTASVKAYAGGAVFVYSGSPTFTNCLFYNNKAEEAGALANGSGSPMLYHCSFFGNQAEFRDGGAIYDEAGQIVVRNSIIWGNTAARFGDQIFSVGAVTTTVTYSDVQGGWSGTGNISSDPLFVSQAANDYRLQSGSPCKNTGRNADVPYDDGDLDWDGIITETLPLDLTPIARQIGTVDMGAYEYEYAACVVDADCASGSVCCSYQCMEWECCDDNDCTDPIQSTCRLSDHTCVECVECCSDADCTGLLPKCRLSDNTCVQCLSDNDCLQCCKASGLCGPCGGPGGPGGNEN